MSETIILYDFHGSPCARQVRIVMLEKGLEWETRLVDLTRMEQKRPEYLALNPNGLVPTLVHDIGEQRGDGLPLAVESRTMSSNSLFLNHANLPNLCLRATLSA
jgi:glutathione S-transferase